MEIEDDTAEQPHSRDTCYGGSSSISATRRTSPEPGPHAGQPGSGILHDHRQKNGDLERRRSPRSDETLHFPTPLMPASSFGRKLVPLVLTQSRASRYNDDERKDDQRGEKDTSQRKFGENSLPTHFFIRCLFKSRSRSTNGPTKLQLRGCSSPHLSGSLAKD